MDTVEQGSTIGYEINFFDDEIPPNLVIPNPSSIFYTLRDEAGDVVNSLLDVAVTPEATTIFISVDGVSTTVVGKRVIRVLFVHALYNSVDFGNNKPLVDVKVFQIVDRKT